MGDSRERVVFGIVRKLAVAVLLGTSYLNRFLQGVFPAELKTVPSNAKPVPILTIKYMLEEHRDKVQDVTIVEKHAPRLVRVPR